MNRLITTCSHPEEQSISALNCVMSSSPQFKCIQELLEAKEVSLFHSTQTTFFDKHIPNICGKWILRKTHDNLKQEETRTSPFTLLELST